MAQLVLTSDTLAGTPATGTLEYNGQFFGTDSAAARAQMQRITLGTPVASTSGTSIDFTSIPAWVKKITVMFKQVSTNGTSILQVQLGDSGGIETTGYVSTIQTSGTRYTSTTGYNLVGVGSATWSLMGTVVLTSQDASNTWIGNITIADDLAAAVYVGAGYKATSGTLDRIRITTVNGTDTFDAGSVNILYEG